MDILQSTCLQNIEIKSKPFYIYPIKVIISVAITFARRPFKLQLLMVRKRAGEPGPGSVFFLYVPFFLLSFQGNFIINEMEYLFYLTSNKLVKKMDSKQPYHPIKKLKRGFPVKKRCTLL